MSNCPAMTQQPLDISYCKQHDNCTKHARESELDLINITGAFWSLEMWNDQWLWSVIVFRCIHLSLSAMITCWQTYLYLRQVYWTRKQLHRILCSYIRSQHLHIATINHIKYITNICIFWSSFQWCHYIFVTWVKNCTILFSAVNVRGQQIESHCITLRWLSTNTENNIKEYPSTKIVYHSQKN